MARPQVAVATRTTAAQLACLLALSTLVRGLESDFNHTEQPVVADDIGDEGEAEEGIESLLHWAICELSPPHLPLPPPPSALLASSRVPPLDFPRGPEQIRPLAVTSIAFAVTCSQQRPGIPSEASAGGVRRRGAEAEPHGPQGAR